MVSHQIKEMKWMCLKVDLDKAYDSVDRLFVIPVMEHMGFAGNGVIGFGSVLVPPSFRLL